MTGLRPADRHLAPAEGARAVRGLCRSLQPVAPGRGRRHELELAGQGAERRHLERARRARDLPPVFSLERQPQLALRRLVQVVHHHHAEGPALPGLERRLEEVEVDAQRLEGLAHVVREGRVELQGRHVAEVVGGVDARIAAREVDEVDDAGVVAVGAPVLGLGGRAGRRSGRAAASVVESGPRSCG